MVTGSKTSLGAQGVQPGVTTSDSLDKELEKDKITDVLGDYMDDTETANAVNDLIRAHPELAGNEAPEAMDVDMQPPLEPVARVQEAKEVQDQPMETKQAESSLGTFKHELGMPGYTQSLIGSTHQPPSPITAEDNALLDADPDAPGLSQSKAPGAGRLEGSPKSKMILRKRKT